jgi:hypothetical protein
MDKTAPQRRFSKIEKYEKDPTMSMAGGLSAITDNDNVVLRINSIEDLRKLADALEQQNVDQVEAKVVYRNPKRI